MTTDSRTDEFSMALCAIRYCIGRSSYAVDDGARWAREYGRRSPWVRETIIRDLSGLAERCDILATDDRPSCGLLGAPDAEATWRAVLAELRGMAP